VVAWAAVPTLRSEILWTPWLLIRTERTAKSCSAPVRVASSLPVAIFPKQAWRMMFPAYAVENNSV
jgi:hypothetical protein